MKIALVITVKNEERILRNNLLYHKYCGIDYAFIYLDNTTDGTESTIEDLDFVSITNSVEASKYSDFKYLEKFTKKANEHHTARQCLNTYDALLKSRDKGFDWIISIDADELVTMDINRPSDFKGNFANLNPNVELISFKTVEVLQQKIEYGNVFAEADLFKTRRSFKYRGESVFKYLYNPIMNMYEKHSFWYGQTMGKAAIRVDKNIIPTNVHRYEKISGDDLIKVKGGFILHYHAYDAKDFIKKYRNFHLHPNQFLSGNNVDSLKLMLKNVVNNLDFSENKLKRYFKDNLIFEPKEIKKLLKNKRFGIFPRKEIATIRITSAIKTFETILKNKMD